MDCKAMAGKIFVVKYNSFHQLALEPQEQDNDAVSVDGDHYPSSSKRRCLGFRREEEQETEAVSILPCSKSRKRQRFTDDEDLSASSSSRTEEKHRTGEEDDTKLFLKSSQRSSKGQRFLDPSSKHREGVKGSNDGVLVEPKLKSSGQSTRQHSTDAEDRRQEEEEDDQDAVFYKPWIDNKDPSSSSPSQDEYLALLLLHLSRGHQTQTQTQTLPQVHPKRQPQSQTQQSQPHIDSFKCSICGKGFSSYQALGGHKASHRVRPPQPQTRPKMLFPSEKIQKCSICHIVFPTGQALGRHKRLHYEGLLGGNKHDHYGVSLGSRRDQPSLSTNGSDITNMERVGRVIDLNKPASPEYNEDGVEEVESGIAL